MPVVAVADLIADLLPPIESILAIVAQAGSIAGPGSLADPRPLTVTETRTVACSGPIPADAGPVARAGKLADAGPVARGRKLADAGSVARAGKLADAGPVAGSRQLCRPGEAALRTGG